MAKRITAQQIWEKHYKLFNDCDKSKVRVWNDEDNKGFWWTVDGYTIYFVGGGSVAMSVTNKTWLPKIGEAVKESYEHGVLVKKEVHGRAGSEKVRKLTGTRDMEYYSSPVECYVNEKFLKGLPKNTLMYITAYTRPVFVTMDAAGIPPVKMIMPMGIRTTFVPNEGEEE